MSSILTIDQGNTSIKLKVFRGNEELHCSRQEGMDYTLLEGLIEKYGVLSAAYCSTARIDVRLIESLRNILQQYPSVSERYGKEVLVLSSNTPLPIDISAYRTPRTLGVDRIAAMCGAAKLFPGEDIIVADAGTAITIDVLKGGHYFMGGNISAGVALRLRALNEHTASLPLIAADGNVTDFGIDTETAMRDGALHGAADEILAAHSRATRVWKSDFRMLLTGGDASLIYDCPTNREAFDLQLSTTKVKLIPDLVSIGLISILEYNEYI